MTRLNIKYYSILALLLMLNLFPVPLLSQNILVPPSPMSIGVGDFDLDGDLDIVTGHNPIDSGSWEGGIYFLENLGDCNFIPMDSIYSFGWQQDIQVGFLNNDNQPDVLCKYEDPEAEIEYAMVVTGLDQDSVKFFTYGTYEGISYSRLLDYDNDGDMDIAFTYDYWENGNPYGTVGLLTNKGNGVFSQPKEYSAPYPNGFAVGDLNSDGYDDAIAGGAIISMFFGTDSGFTIEEIEGSGGYARQIHDMNNDGWNDIAVLEWNGPGQDKNIYLYYNLGDGHFDADSSDVIHIAQGGCFVYAEDLNNDQYADIVFNSAVFYPNGPHDTDSTYVILNYGNGNFEEVKGYYTGINSEKSLIADMNGDGYNDILTTSHAHSIYPGKGVVHLLVNDGTGHFYENGSAIDEPKTIIPENYLLLAYPNPFNPEITLSYGLTEDAHTTLMIYDMRGQLIQTLQNAFQTTGTYEFTWQPMNLGSGVYIVCLRSGNNTNMQKIVYVK